nr:hypothetical protein [Tanacetum cinerariifolium]
MNAPVVIIGTGLAGYNLAREFRKLDGETPLLLITADDGRSYSKPMLSTGFGKNKEADGLSMAEPGTMAEQLKAEVRTHTRVSGIDPGHKRLWVDEEAVYYRDLVLAWGAETVRVPVAGDADGLEAHLSDGEVLHCDLVVSAIGLRPRTDLAAAAGLEIGRGVVVDRQLQTSHANIYALGDCAEVDGLNLLYVMPLMNCARALAQTLNGTPAAVSYGPMPVTVKTPVCPLVVSPPPKGSEGTWAVEGEGADIKALCRDPEGNLLGYALTGTAVMEKLALNKALPSLLA